MNPTCRTDVTARRVGGEALDAKIVLHVDDDQRRVARIEPLGQRHHHPRLVGRLILQPRAGPGVGIAREILRHAVGARHLSF
jgi:hypothetical protein